MLPPEGVSVSEVQPHSVQVSWQAVEGADTYNVTFTQTMGDQQQGLCSGSHTVSVSTESSSLSVVVGEDDMLRPFTTYSIAVVSVSDVFGHSGDSEPTTVTIQHRQVGNTLYHKCRSTVDSLYIISHTDSTAALLNFRATAQSSSSIFVQWDRLPVEMLMAS